MPIKLNRSIHFDTKIFYLCLLLLFLLSSCVTEKVLYLRVPPSPYQDINPQQNDRTGCRIYFEISKQSPRRMSFGYLAGREIKSLNMQEWLAQELISYENDAFYFKQISPYVAWSGERMEVKLHKFYITPLKTSFNANILLSFTRKNQAEKYARGFIVKYNWIFTAKGVNQVFHQTFEKAIQNSSEYFLNLCAKD